jgi:hypothetical protein
MSASIITIALTALSSCSGNATRPGAARDALKGSQLGVFMKTHMNPPFSKISFLLFHDDEGDAEITADELPTSADDLAKTAERLAQWQDLPGGSPESKLVFAEYAEALKTDAINLIDALHSDQPDTAIKVFESLRKKCDSCHHFFRFDESMSLEQPARGGSK